MRATPYDLRRETPGGAHGAALGEDGGVISVALARRLREAGLRWEPARGDAFVIVDRGIDEDVFVLSDMTIEVHEFPTGPEIGFNGTVEWALDSVEKETTLWLPREDQLRERLGGTFVRLERRAERHLVVLEVAGRGVTVEADEPAEAYGLALLHLATGEDPEHVAGSLRPRSADPEEGTRT